MPFIPRRYANTTGVPPELMQRPVAQHAPIPIRQASAEGGDGRPARLSLAMGKLNMREYEPDFKQLYKTLFGKDPVVDPYTRQLSRPADPKK